MTRLVPLTLTSAILLCLGACTPGHNGYSAFENIPTHGWLYGDTLSFAPDSLIHDSVMTARLNLAVRHGNNYPYANLWLEVTHTSPAGSTCRDTLNLTLADIYGRWQGSGFGASYQFETTVTQATEIDMRAPVTIRHIMRTDTLTGLEQLGISITQL